MTLCVKHTKQRRVFAHSPVSVRGVPQRGFRHGEFILKGRQGLDYLAGFLLGKAQLVELFQVEPELRTRAEEVPRRRAVSSVVARSGPPVAAGLGDYNWRQNKQVEQGDFRSLQPLVGAGQARIMWFDEDLKSAYEIGFQVGILNAGYDPVRVDQVGVSSRNGKNRTLSHQKQLASALNRRVCEGSQLDLEISQSIELAGENLKTTSLSTAPLAYDFFRFVSVPRIERGEHGWADPVLKPDIDHLAASNHPLRRCFSQPCRQSDRGISYEAPADFRNSHIPVSELSGSGAWNGT